MLKTMRKQGGFTLIEVVAAAALIGIMATMLLPSLSGYSITAASPRHPSASSSSNSR